MIQKSHFKWTGLTGAWVALGVSLVQPLMVPISSAWSAPRANSPGEISVEQAHEIRDFLNLPSQSVLAMTSDVLARGEERLLRERNNDESHQRALSIAEDAMRGLAKTLHEDEGAALHFAGVREGRLYSGQMSLHLQYLATGMEGVFLSSGDSALDAAMALRSYAKRHAVREIARAERGLDRVEESLSITYRKLSDAQASRIANAPNDAAVDFTLGMLCLGGAVASVAATPVTGGTSLLATVGAVAGAGALLKQAISIGDRLKNGEDLTAADGTILLAAIPFLKGAKGIAALQKAAIAANVGLLAASVKPSDLMSSDPERRLRAFTAIAYLAGMAVHAAGPRIRAGTWDGDSAARINQTVAMIGRNLSRVEKEALIRAHEVGQGAAGADGTEARGGNYTREQLAEKARILKEAGFTGAERESILRAGIAGAANPALPAEFPEQVRLSQKEMMKKFKDEKLSLFKARPDKVTPETLADKLPNFTAWKTINQLMGDPVRFFTRLQLLEREVAKQAKIDGSTPEAALEKVLTRVEKRPRNGFGEAHDLENRGYSASEWYTMLAEGRPFNDLAFTDASTSRTGHANRTHRIQWFVVMKEMEYYPERFRNPDGTLPKPVELFKQLGDPQTHVIWKAESGMGNDLWYNTFDSFEKNWSCPEFTYPFHKLLPLVGGAWI